MELPDFEEIEIFWGELSPCEHAVQLYEDDAVFLESLQGFVAGGLRNGEAVVVIGTSPHLNALEERLQADGIDLISARAQNLYLPLDATAALSQFVVDGWPDAQLFETMVMGILKKVRKPGRKVRAFGEMVAVMWQSGLQGGTVRLEHLWQVLCRRESLPLFCAYPRTGFTEEATASLQEICALHTKVLGGRLTVAPAAA